MKFVRPLPAEGQQPRITELWAWTVIDPLTDVEGIVAVTLHGRGSLPMVFSMRETAERFEVHVRPIARELEAPVRLRRFTETEIIKEITW